MPKRIKCLGPGCHNTVRQAETKTGFCKSCMASFIPVQGKVPETPSPAAQLTEDRQKQRVKSELQEVRKKYNEALKTIAQQESELGILADLRTGLDATVCIEPRQGSGTSEATPVIIASDWHAEELVTPAQVNGLNEFNLDIADKRITKFWQSSLRLVRLLNQDVKINTVVLGLLGDFITNDIHEELVENVALSPTAAIIWVQQRLIAGIEFLLNHSSYEFVVVCRVGNHSRTTKKVHFSTENGHSLEHLLYVHLAAYFRNEPRIKFVIQDGYHAYVDVYDVTLRMHHGHAIKYGGGIGGLFIPAFKAVSQWSKARHADLDVFGHFHQSKDGGTFLCNGSLIGYNSFAVTIRADYERPQQSLFLIDKRRGRTCTWPILVS